MINSIKNETGGRNVSPLFLTVKVGKWLTPLILLLADYYLILFAFLCAYLVRAYILPYFFHFLPEFTFTFSYLYFVLPFIYMFLIFYERLYTRRPPFWQGVESLIKVCFYATILTIGIMYFSGAAKIVSRIFVAASSFLIFTFLTMGRYFVIHILSAGGLWQKPVIIIGDAKTVDLLAHTFTDINLGYRIVGIIEDNDLVRPHHHSYPLIGNFYNAEQAIIRNRIKDVIIADPNLSREKLLDLIYRIQPHVNNLYITPNLFRIPITELEIEALYNQDTLLNRIHNNMTDLHNRMLKQALDIICSITGIILLSPFMLVISILIYLESPGPVFFAHQRIGFKGKPFFCYKFRTMVVNAEKVLENYLANNQDARREWTETFKLKEDPRITKIGKWLRRTSLDELPQLFNVVKGEMSLVGPRPIVADEIVKYGKFINDYYIARPGITGYWQVSGRSDTQYDTRVEMDSWYIRNWSLWLDIVLLIKTIKVVHGRKGAY